MSLRIISRVARGYAAVVLRDVPADRIIEYREGGTISARDLERMLRPHLGFVMRLRFRPSLKIDPNGVEFEALTEDADVVTGRLVLHAAVAEDRGVWWAEVVVDGVIPP